MVDRERREQEFHDRAYTEDLRRAAHRFYAVTAASNAYYRSLAVDGSGSRVLEIGCGTGHQAVVLASRGARVTAIDLSPTAVELAAGRAAGAAGDVDFRVMSAHQLEFDDATFDVVCGRAILHHLDLGTAYREIARVLKPDGRAVFWEALGHNPLIRRYRERTPGLRSPDEHPLTIDDLRAAGRWFGATEWRAYHLATLAAIPFRRLPGFTGLIRVLDGVDRVLFRAAPPLRKHGWVAVLTLTDPRR